MPTISGRELEAFLHGAASYEPGSAGGLVPHRLTPAQRAQVVDLLYNWVERNAAGVTVTGHTDGPAVDLTVRGTSMTTGAQPAGNPRLAVRTARGTTIVEVTGGDILNLDMATMSVHLEPGQDFVVPIQVGEDGLFEVLLPHNSPIEVISLSSATAIGPVMDDRLKWVHHGSSISHCANSPDPTQTWPQQVADAWDVDLRNLAFGGNAQLDPFMARMIKDTPADLITLCFGINNINADSMRERAFRPALHGFIDTIRDGHPITPIVLLGGIHCLIHEDAPGPVVDDGMGKLRVAQRSVEQDLGALTLARARAIVEELATLRAQNDRNLHYLDAREFFGEADAGLLYDSLHPDQTGNDLIASRIIAKFPAFPISAT